MSSDPRLVPMELFLQDQKRQDDDIRESRAALERAVDNVVREVRGLRTDATMQADLLREAITHLTTESQVEDAVEAIKDKQILTRREKMWALILVGLPLVAGFFVNALNISF